MIITDYIHFILSVTVVYKISSFENFLPALESNTIGKSHLLVYCDYDHQMAR